MNTPTEHIERIFYTGDTAPACTINLLGADNVTLVAEYISTLDGVSRELLLGNFCEGWRGDLAALAVSVELLSQLHVSTVLRAVMALQMGQQQPHLIPAMLPFYRNVAGFKL